MPVLHSTKNLEIVEPATADRTGVGIFEYTDHYTVFHYGRMPDPIPGKGEATCRMAVFNFRMLQAAGVPTHFRRFLPPNQIEFDLARLPEPGTGRLADNTLIPVQVLVRNELPQGSSVHRRLASGTLTLDEVGLTDMPKVGERLLQPLVEFATMFEPVNRFVGRSEAVQLAGLSAGQLRVMSDITVKANEVLAGHAERVGLTFSDGKAEFLSTNDERIVLADSPGTPDEARLLFSGVHCGKQVLRNWYVNNGLEVPTGRLIAEGVPRDLWPEPAPLPAAFLPVMSDLYRSLSEAWTGERLWNAPSLDDATRAVTEVIGR
ncbi:phosphoribosylaminoimidazolesuccinocarboxamide synthase [Actinoplanes sichuanensis]|uniref:phosphoribosylaminoimidazolesuccinocarboxamide synthase n=1 Tax=Actinoplanes sichuanensis TaxID=512349 RepID=A0ABW4A1I3_9ACTN|nr:phosphoribosylaminoimidazolesuccinocarboxamide synthase [Actinoplanes sichuanensis]BEL12970.1 phosphoribosylaminoimidazolesuccinocarboxamide synthase [Actinoplanes sichuanensis]